MANTDAKALQRYLAAIGLDVTADRVNDLLTILAVVMIEAGGGLSLALGLALPRARLLGTDRLEGMSPQGGSVANSAACRVRDAHW